MQKFSEFVKEHQTVLESIEKKNKEVKFNELYEAKLIIPSFFLDIKSQLV